MDGMDGDDGAMSAALDGIEQTLKKWDIGGKWSNDTYNLTQAAHHKPLPTRGCISAADATTLLQALDEFGRADIELANDGVSRMRACCTGRAAPRALALLLQLMELWSFPNSLGNGSAQFFANGCQSVVALLASADAARRADAHELLTAAIAHAPLQTITRGVVRFDADTACVAAGNAALDACQHLAVVGSTAEAMRASVCAATAALELQPELFDVSEGGEGRDLFKSILAGIILTDDVEVRSEVVLRFLDYCLGAMDPSAPRASTASHPEPKAVIIVRVTGLSAKPELNGCLGTVVGARRGERYPVKVELRGSTATVSVMLKPKNLMGWGGCDEAALEAQGRTTFDDEARMAHPMSAELKQFAEDAPADGIRSLWRLIRPEDSSVMGPVSAESAADLYYLRVGGGPATFLPTTAENRSKYGGVVEQGAEMLGVFTRWDEATGAPLLEDLRGATADVLINEVLLREQSCARLGYEPNAILHEQLRRRCVCVWQPSYSSLEGTPLAEGAWALFVNPPERRPDPFVSLTADAVEAEDAAVESEADQTAPPEAVAAEVAVADRIERYVASRAGRGGRGGRGGGGGGCCPVCRCERRRTAAPSTRRVGVQRRRGRQARGHDPRTIRGRSGEGLV